MRVLFPYSAEIYRTNLEPLVDYFTSRGDAVICTAEDNWEALDARPDVVISNQAWWKLEHEIGKKALAAGIPHVTIEHGAPMFYQGGPQYYRREIGAADVKCLWGQHNFDMMQRYKCPPENLRITGYPRFDGLLNYSAQSNPQPRILFLGTWKIPGKIFDVWQKVLEQAKVLGYTVAYKPHPNESTRGELLDRARIPDRVEIVRGENLFEEVARADAVITSPTSVLIPVFYYEKPVYSYYPWWQKGLFQFHRTFKLPGVGKNRLDLEKLVQQRVNRERYQRYFEYTAFKADGRNRERIYQLCQELATS